MVISEFTAFSLYAQELFTHPRLPAPPPGFQPRSHHKSPLLRQYQLLQFSIDKADLLRTHAHPHRPLVLNILFLIPSPYPRNTDATPLHLPSNTPLFTLSLLTPHP